MFRQFGVNPPPKLSAILQSHIESKTVRLTAQDEVAYPASALAPLTALAWSCVPTAR
jgi:hypothetical protein